MAIDKEGDRYSFIRNKLRDTQKLIHDSSISILNRPPSHRQGSDGDMVFVSMADKVYLYCKVKNRWHNISVGDDLREELDGSALTSGFSGGYSYDSGWFPVFDSGDNNSVLYSENRGGYHTITHNTPSELMHPIVFCRFEALRDGGVEPYVVNLTSHISNSGPNSSRYGYWINIVNSTTMELYIHPDGLSILHSDVLKDTSSNSSVLLSSYDTANYAAIEMRVITYPIFDKSGQAVRMERNRNVNDLYSTSTKRVGTGLSVVNDKGAAVDGTKNSSFSIDSDGTGVLLKNDSGTLKVRNLDDDADGHVQCSSIKDANGNKILETDATGGSVVNNIKISNAVSGSGPIVLATGTDTNIDLTMKTTGAGKLTLDAGGTVEINADSGNIKFKDDTTVLGQINSSGNFTATGTSASSAGTCLGDYQYESKICNYYTTVVANFIPLAGYTIEKTAGVGNNEFIAMVAPYDGIIEKILWRSEIAQDGTLQMDIHESSDGTEIPGLSPSGTKDTVIDIADDIAQEISFASMTSGTNVLRKGRIYSIKITSPSASNDTNTTVVFKWDVTT